MCSGYSVPNRFLIYAIQHAHRFSIEKRAWHRKAKLLAAGGRIDPDMSPTNVTWPRLSAANPSPHHHQL